MSEREEILIGLVRSLIGALRRIDSANGALSEGAGSVLHDNPDPLARAMREATAHGQNAYISASLALGGIGLGKPDPEVELHALAVRPAELAALNSAASSELRRIMHLIGQVELVPVVHGAEQSTRLGELRAAQQMWLGLQGKVVAALVAYS